MKNTKLWSIVLASITILTMVFDLVKENAELFGISADAITKIGFMLTIVKLIYDNRDLFTAQDVADFTNENDYMTAKEIQNKITSEDVINWKKNRS